MKSCKNSVLKEIFLVCKFTVKQSCKTKSFQISFAILACLAFFGPIIMGIIQAKPEDNMPNNTEISTLYIGMDLGEVKVDFEKLLEDDFYSKMKIEYIEMKDVEERKNALEKEGKNQLLVEVNHMESNFQIKAWEPVKNSFWERDVETLLERMSAILTESIQLQCALTDSQKLALNTQVNTEVHKVQENGEIKNLSKKTGIAESDSMFIYGFIMVILMIGAFAGSSIASSVVSEKNGKILEYLLTSISPIGILAGKIIGCILLTVGEILCIGAIAVVADGIAKNISNQEGSMIGSMLPDTIISNLSLGTVVLVLFFIVLNLTLYGFLAAYAGSLASKVEELKDTVGIFSIAELVGGYLALFSAMYMTEGTTSLFLKFVYLFPLSSVFMIPGALLVGKVNFFMVFLAIVFVMISIIVLVIVTIKTYKTHLFSSGVKKKKKRLIKFSRQ